MLTKFQLIKQLLNVESSKSKINTFKFVFVMRRIMKSLEQWTFSLTTFHLILSKINWEYSSNSLEKFNYAKLKNYNLVKYHCNLLYYFISSGVLEFKDCRTTIELMKIYLKQPLKVNGNIIIIQPFKEKS